MKAWTKDQRNQLNVELRGQHISSETVQVSEDGDAIVPTPTFLITSSSNNGNPKSTSEAETHSRYRNLRPNQRPMTCKPRSRNMADKQRFKQQEFSSSSESLFGPEVLTCGKVTTNNEKATAVAWGEKDNHTKEISKEMHDGLPRNQFQQRGTTRIFQKRNQKETILFDNGANESVEEHQLLKASSFPVRRMFLQHQTPLKGKKQPFRSASPSKTTQSQVEMSRERHQCVIPSTATEPTVYDSIDTERLLRLNLFDPVLMSDLQEELVSKQRTENRKYLSTVAPPSSPRFGSPTPQADTACLSVHQINPNADISTSNMSCSDGNTNTPQVTARQAASSSKNVPVVDQYDLLSVPSSPHLSSTNVQNTEEHTNKVLENYPKDNTHLHNGGPSSFEEALSYKEPNSDVRVRSVQLLCTHSGRLRHTATLVETYPMNFPTFPDKEATRNVTTATNKVFISKSNYKPIRMVYEEKGPYKMQESGQPVTGPNMQRYLSYLQMKQMKLKKERGMSPQVSASSLSLEDGIYKTIKTYHFNPKGLQETVQKMLLCKNSSPEKRPMTSSSESSRNKPLWKTRPQSGPSRIYTGRNTFRKSSGAKSSEKTKESEKRKNQGTNDREPEQPRVVTEQQNPLGEEKDEDDNPVSMETQPSQIIPRVHFESKPNNRNVSLNSILKKSTQETNSSLSGFDFKEKASTCVETVKNISADEPYKNNANKFEKQSSKKEKTISYSDTNRLKKHKELQDLRVTPNSVRSCYGNEFGKGTERQSEILFNGIGASSDSGRSFKEVSFEEAQKRLETGVSIIPTETPKNILKKGNKVEKKRVSFNEQKSDSLLATSSLDPTISSEKESVLAKEINKNNPSSHPEVIKHETANGISEKEAQHYLTTTKYMQADKKETSSDRSPSTKNYDINRRLPQDFRNYGTPTASLPSQSPTVNALQKDVKPDTKPHSAKSKPERKHGSSKKTKSTKVRIRSKSNKLTGPPIYLTTVKSQIPIDDNDFECEKISERLMENGVCVSWKTIRGGLHPPSGRSLHYEIADTGLTPPSDLLSHPKNWFPKEYKELQQATKNLERADLTLWKQKKAEDKKFGTKRKKKTTKKKKK